MRNRLTFCFLAIVLSGCGSFASVGNSDFSCDQPTGGVSCGRASDIYEVADKPGNEDGVSAASLSNKGGASTSGEYREGELSRRGSGVAATTNETRSGASANKFFGKEPQIAPGSPDQLLILNPPAADPTDPMRSERVKQRVWIAPWVSDSGAWHGQQVIFVDISQREWQNGVINSQPNIPIFKPLD